MRENPGLFGLGWSLSMGGGGRSGRSLIPRGRLSACCNAEELYVDIGGLFVVCPRDGSGGRFLGAGRGGGGLLPVAGCCCAFKLFPTPCWFNAAIRADSDVNCGSSSTSVIVNTRDQYNCVCFGLSDDGSECACVADGLRSRQEYEVGKLFA